MEQKLFVILLLFGLLAFVGCTRQAEPSGAPEQPQHTDSETAAQTQEKPEITQSRHRREDGYAADFTTYCLTFEDCTVQMEARYYEETALRDAARKVQLDLAAMAEKTGKQPRAVTVYLVNQTITGGTQIVDHRVFCTMDDVENRSCRWALAQAAYDLEQLWQAVGLNRYVFAQDPDEAALLAYYAGGAHDNLLSLFPMYFLPGFADGETMEMAGQTAQCVTAKILETGGMEEFCAPGSAAEAVRQWLDAAGMDAPALPAGADTVGRLTIASLSENSVILQADEEMNPFRFELEPTDWIETADEFYGYLCRFYEGYTVMLAQMEAALPTAFQQVRQNAEEQITVKIISNQQMSYAQGQTVNISWGTNIWHEVTHVLLPSQVGYLTDRWLTEGLAEYFATPIETAYHWGENYVTMHQYFFGDMPEEYRETLNEDDWKQRECIIRCYTARCPVPETGNDFDRGWLYRACAITTILRSELCPAEELSANAISVAEKSGFSALGKEADGNGLSYPEALLMTDYLAEIYGIDDVVNSYLSHEACEQAYGMAYPDLYEAFQVWVQDTYGALLD